MGHVVQRCIGLFQEISNHCEFLILWWGPIILIHLGHQWRRSRIKVYLLHICWFGRFHVSWFRFPMLWRLPLRNISRWNIIESFNIATKLSCHIFITSIVGGSFILWQLWSGFRDWQFILKMERHRWLRRDSSILIIQNNILVIDRWRPISQDHGWRRTWNLVNPCISCTSFHFISIRRPPWMTNSQGLLRFHIML